MKPTESVLKIISEYQNDAPVNVEAIIRALGVELDTKAVLDDHISGQIHQLLNGHYKISVNRNDHYYRQRFTMAHELGHFLLHRALIGDGVDDSKMYRSTEYGNFYNQAIQQTQETEANQFAAWLLMPFSLIKSLQAEGVKDPQEIARKLKVSKAAIDIRLGNLELNVA